MRVRFSLAVCTLLSAVCASAQSAPPTADAVTQPVPDAQAIYIPYGTPIRLVDAKKVMAAALANAQKRGWKMACAVVEPTGDLVAFERMDDTQYASVGIAQDKARTSARYRRSTKYFFDQAKAGNSFVLSLPGAIAAEGGFPIVRDGKLIGAIGCSGAAGNQDATVALAGLEAIK